MFALNIQVVFDALATAFLIYLFLREPPSGPPGPPGPPGRDGRDGRPWAAEKED